MGLKSVCQPEPGLRRVTPLALATRLLGNSHHSRAPKNIFSMQIVFFIFYRKSKTNYIILPRSPEILSIPLCVIFGQVWLPSSLENPLTNPKNSRVAAAVLLDRWFVCKQRIFLSCDVVKVVGYYHEIFMRHLYLNYWNVFSWNQNHEMHHKMQWNTKTFVYDVTSQM